MGILFLRSRDTGRPGFFVVFGLMFGGPTSLILLAIIFGTPNPENGPFATIVTGLFLTPFIVIGLGTFFNRGFSLVWEDENPDWPECRFGSAGAFWEDVSAKKNFLVRI